MSSQTPDDDPYAPAAEFYDVLAAAFLEPLRPAFAAAIEGADPTFGPILDVGAGTGLSTILIADALPGASIVALEPSASLRAILTSRVVSRADLKGRVTVYPSRFAEAVLPARLGGAVVLGSLGHFHDEERRQLWASLAHRLGAGCPAVVRLMPPTRPVKQPLERYAREQVGLRTYEGWSAAEPSGPRSLRWTMTYRILEDDRVVVERSVEQGYLTVGEQDVAEEVRSVGLDCTVAGAGLLRLLNQVC